MKLCTHSHTRSPATTTTTHTQDVQPNSPAFTAGLRSGTDYIVAADSLLDSSDDLYALIEKHNMKQLRLYVYNSEDDHCREVTITPNDAWGGEGRCVFGGKALAFAAHTCHTYTHTHTHTYIHIHTYIHSPCYFFLVIVSLSVSAAVLDTDICIAFQRGRAMPTPLLS